MQGKRRLIYLSQNTTILTLSLAPGPTATTVPSNTEPTPFSGRRTPPLVFYKKKTNKQTESHSLVCMMACIVADFALSSI